MLDSGSNQYLYFAFPGTDNNTHIAKKNSDGTQLWVKEYPGFYFKRGYRNTQMSKDESVIRILGESLSNIIQFIEISTSDGAVTSAYETIGSNRMASFWHQSNIDCSNTTNTICYYIGRGSATLAYTLSKFDFSSPGTIALLDPDSFQSVYTSVAVLSDNEVLVTGIYSTSAVDEHFFFKLNFTAETYDWTIQTAPNEEAFGGNFDRYTISFLNDAFTQFYTIFRQVTTSVIFILNPDTGSLIGVKHISYPESITDSRTTSSAKLSDNQILLTFLSSDGGSQFVDIINSDTWEKTSYISANIYLFGSSPIFNTDQVILLYAETSSDSFFTLQASYDKLHFTELFNQSTHTLTDITSNYTLNAYSNTLAAISETTTSLTITPTNATLNVNSDKSYKVKVNIFSQNHETYTRVVNTTASIGPLGYD